MQLKESVTTMPTVRPMKDMRPPKAKAVTKDRRRCFGSMLLKELVAAMSAGRPPKDGHSPKAKA